MKIALFTAALILTLIFSSALTGSVKAETAGDKRFTENGADTITDSQTGLMWIKNDSYLHSGHWLNWFEANDYINQLNEAGFASYYDWRLPTTRELKTLYDSEKLNSSQVSTEMKIHTDPIFGKNGSGSLWSADENGRHNAFGVVFNTGDVFSGNKKSKSRKATRAVRTNTVDHK